MDTPFPPHFGINFTPTIHSKIPANIDPTKTQLPSPFVVVITGAGKGLGYHMALAYAQAGATALSISSRTPSDLATLESAILSINPAARVLKTTCDTQSAASVAALAAAVRKTFSRVDVVIANAGIISKYVVDKASSEGSESGSSSNLPAGLLEDGDWSRVLDVNLLGTWRTAKAFLPLLVESKDGPQTLICSTSLAAHSLNSSICPIAYNVSKIACNRLIEHIANDHGKDGVQAYALHPGAVLTPQTQGHKGDAWGPLLSDDEGLAGAMCVWLSREKREWLSGRYISCNWDVGELEGMKREIVEGDKLKFRMVV